jgi:translocation and assembly module TamA
VVFRVVEGRPTRVTKVTVNGLDAAPEAGAALGALPIAPGAIFTLSAYDAARARIADALGRTGWATAEVRQRAEVHPEAATAEVTYDVTVGRRWRFGQISIAGPSELPRGRILDQALGAVTPGAWWDESRLAVAQARVFQLGAFGGVRVQRAKPDEEQGTIGIVVVIQPAPFRTVRVGPGLELTPIKWDLHLLGSWQDRNFFGDLRKFGVEAQLGWAWIPTPFREVSAGPAGHITFDFSQPGAFARWLDASVRFQVERGVEQGYDYFAQRLKLSLPLRLASRWKLVPSYNIEVYTLSNYGSLFTPNLASGGPSLENCQGNICLLSYLEQFIAWDGRDDPLNTRSGVFAGITVQEGFHVGGFGYRYLRFFPELRLFKPVWGQTIVAMRARVGGLIPLSEPGLPPIVVRFAAGGPLSMRGYYTRRLAPMALENGLWIPLGGNGIVDGAVELRFPVAGPVGGALFVDAASISDASGNPQEWVRALDPATLQWAVGFGVRYVTPFGPLRVDLGFRLPDRWSLAPDAFPAVPYTRYPDGGFHREPIIAINVSLGEAF